jgi:hypothetical protein
MAGPNLSFFKRLHERPLVPKPAASVKNSFDCEQVVSGLFDRRREIRNEATRNKHSYVFQYLEVAAVTGVLDSAGNLEGDLRPSRSFRLTDVRAIGG